MGCSQSQSLFLVRLRSSQLFCGFVLFFGIPTSPLLAEVYDLTDDVWRFHIGDIPEAQAADFDDSAWDRVSIPHTWNALDAQDGKNRKSQMHPSGYRRTAAWYRQVVNIPVTHVGQRTFLRCDGASLVKEVYVNGHLVGEHKGAFSAFCFEITDYLIPGKDAVVSIRVDNSELQGRNPADFNLEPGRKTPDIAPIRGDFNLYGGIYRGIELITKPAVCISATTFASSGVYVTTPEVSSERAVVRAEAVISVRGNVPNPYVLTAVLRDREGEVVARSERVISPQDGKREALELEVLSPRLWNGIKDPYLYSLEMSLSGESDNSVDSVSEEIGIRSLVFDPARGFILNGKPIRLRGVNRHQDWQDRGWAISRNEHEIDFAMIREIGSNAVRLAHYPQDTYVLELCDQLGLIVLMEIPLVGWIDPSEAFSDNLKIQLQEMIHQHYNRASIPVWGLWNELYHRAPDYMASPIPLVEELNAFAKAEDPTRPTVASANDSSNREPRMRDITDLIAWNVYPGWYGDGSPDDMSEMIEERLEVDGRAMIAISEYGAGASIHQHEDWSQLKKPEARHPWHPEEYQAFFHERAWRALEASDRLWGTFVWNMFDFAADHRDEGDRPGINDKGLVTHDRKVRKDAFYFYQASWTEDPVVHITSRRFSPRPAGSATVKVYSNADKVELLVDGHSFGVGTRDGVVHLWENIKLEPGEVEIKATADFEGRISTDKCVWIVETSKN